MLQRPSFHTPLGFVKLLALAALALTLSMAHATCDVRTGVGGAFAVGDDYDAQGTGRRPLVVVAGVTEQLPTADYISTVGGITTNATPAAAGDLQTTTETVATATVTTENVATESVSTRLTDSGQFALSGAITPSAFTGTQIDNYNPAGLATAYVINQAVTSATTITGITAQPTGTIIVFRNLSSSSAVLTFANASGSSLSANQFSLPNGDWKLPVGSSLTLRYSGTEWRLISTSTYELPTLTVDGTTTLNGSLVTSGTQITTSLGTINDLALNASTTVLQFTGSSTVTYTGFTGGVTGRILILENLTAQQVNLQNLTGSAAGNQIHTFAATNGQLLGNPSVAMFIYDGTQWQQVGMESRRLDPNITLGGSLTVTTSATAQNFNGTIAVTASGLGSHFKNTVTGSSDSLSAGCGTGAVVAPHAGDSAGRITLGTSSGTCVITFNTAYENTPACTVDFESAPTTLAFTPAAGSLTVTVTGGDSKTFDYHCIGTGA